MTWSLHQRLCSTLLFDSFPPLLYELARCKTSDVGELTHKRSHPSTGEPKSAQGLEILNVLVPLLAYLGLPLLFTIGFIYTKSLISQRKLPLDSHLSLLVESDNQGTLPSITSESAELVHSSSSRDDLLQMMQSQASRNRTPSGTPLTKTLQLHRQLADQAYRYVTAGLDNDDTGDRTASLDNYRKGVVHLESAIGMSMPTKAERFVFDFCVHSFHVNINLPRQRQSRTPEHQDEGKFEADTT
ncbi:hypothetical protein DFS34DRAFT_485873 [Phlyctochytrium arcticum]|nr:hypothetical protein DFS34DRAFT_485873 [Phlyctochytrium arcticum]